MDGTLAQIIMELVQVTQQSDALAAKLAEVQRALDEKKAADAQEVSGT